MRCDAREAIWALATELDQAHGIRCLPPREGGGERGAIGTMTNDLTRYGDQFPLGTASGADNDGPGSGIGALGGARPFGLRYAVSPPASSVVSIDFSRVSYDPVRQIAIVTEDDGSVLPAMRHTSTRTTTSTASEDRGGPDRDTDATGT